MKRRELLNENVSAARKISLERTFEFPRCLAVSNVTISTFFFFHTPRIYVSFLRRLVWEDRVAGSRTYSRVSARVATNTAFEGYVRFRPPPHSDKLLLTISWSSQSDAQKTLNLFSDDSCSVSSRDTHSCRGCVHEDARVIHATRRPTVMTLANCWAPAPFPNDLSTIATPCQSDTIVSTVIVAINRYATANLSSRHRRWNYRRSNYDETQRRRENWTTREQRNWEDRKVVNVTKNTFIENNYSNISHVMAHSLANLENFVKLWTDHFDCIGQGRV